jgi:hypothetical protein
MTIEPNCVDAWLSRTKSGRWLGNSPGLILFRNVGKQWKKKCKDCFCVSDLNIRVGWWSASERGKRDALVRQFFLNGFSMLPIFSENHNVREGLSMFSSIQNLKTASAFLPF